mgnify:CR=1 FL=1
MFTFNMYYVYAFVIGFMLPLCSRAQLILPTMSEMFQAKSIAKERMDQRIAAQKSSFETFDGKNDEEEEMKPKSGGFLRRLQDISLRSNIKSRASSKQAIDMRNTLSMKKGAQAFWPFTRLQKEKVIAAADTTHWPKAVDLETSTDGSLQDPICGPTRKTLRDRYQKPNWSSYSGYIPVDAGKLFYWLKKNFTRNRKFLM